MNLYRVLPLLTAIYTANAMEEKKKGSDEKFKSSLASWKMPRQADKQISHSTQQTVGNAMQALLDLPDDELISFIEDHPNRTVLSDFLSIENTLNCSKPCNKFKIVCKYFLKTHNDVAHAATSVISHDAPLENKIELFQILQKALANTDHSEIITALLKGLHSVKFEDSDTLPEQLLKYSLESNDIAPNVVRYLVATFPLCNTSTYFDDFMQTFENGQSEEYIIEKSAILHDAKIPLLKSLAIVKLDEFNESLKNITVTIQFLKFQQEEENFYQCEPDQDRTKKIALLEKIKHEIELPPQIEYKDKSPADYFKDKKD